MNSRVGLREDAARRLPERRKVALLVVVAGLVGLFLFAWRWVPWSPVPGGFPVEADPGSVFTADQIARAEGFSRVARWLGWGSLALSTAISLWLGFGTLGRRVASRLPGPGWLAVIQAVVLVLAVGRVATLPFSIAAWNWRRRYALTDQPLGGLLRDIGVSFAVTALITAVAVSFLVALARRFPRAWPAVAGVGLAGLTLVVSFAYPVVVEPLYNDFHPLAHGSLRRQVLELADQEGVGVSEVLVADASRRTTTLNAYVSGFGSSRRVVLYDTLLDSVPESQTLAVVAHELTHARERDVWWGSLMGAAGALLGVGLLGLLMRSLDVAAVPRLLALITIGTLLATPVQSAISRRIEWRADVGALSAGANPEAMVEVQRNLALRALADPTPPKLAYWLFGTHPLALQRVALARQWDVPPRAE